MPGVASVAQWWLDDGLISREQWLDLELYQDDPLRWCALVELWLGMEEAQEQGCLQAPPRSARLRTGWRLQLDSAGDARKQVWNAALNGPQSRGQVTLSADSGWKDAELQRAWLRFQSRLLRAQAGDISAADAGMDPWAGDFQGFFAQASLSAWQAGVLLESPESAGMQAGWSPQKRSAAVSAWLWRVPQGAAFWGRLQGSGWSFTTRFSDPRQGSWNHLRYRRNLRPSLFAIGGEGHLRTGEHLPALLFLPRSFADVRLWSSQWQEVRRGDWRLRAEEVIVMRESADSVALSVRAERRRSQARFSAEMSCRSLRKDCALPRALLGAGLRLWPRGADSLYAQARLQGDAFRELGHIPRLRCGWERRLGSAVRLNQSLTVPENWDGKRALDWRQETWLRLPALGILRVQMQLRWGLRLHPDQGVLPGVFQFRTEGEW